MSQILAQTHHTASPSFDVLVFMVSALVCHVRISMNPFAGVTSTSLRVAVGTDKPLLPSRQRSSSIADVRVEIAEIAAASLLSLSLRHTIPQ